MFSKKRQHTAAAPGVYNPFKHPLCANTPSAQCINLNLSTTPLPCLHVKHILESLHITARRIDVVCSPCFLRISNHFTSSPFTMSVLAPTSPDNEKRSVGTHRVEIYAGVKDISTSGNV